VTLPSGDLIWVRVQAEYAAMGEGASGPSDVGLGQRIAPAAEAFRLPGFTQTVGAWSPLSVKLLMSTRLIH